MAELVLRTTDDRAKELGRIRLDGDRVVFDGGTAEDIFRSVQRRRRRSGGSDADVFALLAKGWSNGPLAMVKADAEKVAAAADDRKRKPADAVAAALLAAWPVMAAPLVADVTKAVTKAGSDVGALGTLTVSKRAVTAVAAKLTPALAAAADEAAAATVADAQAQGAEVQQPDVDRDRLGQVALAAVGLIAMAYAAAAARAAIVAGLDAVTETLTTMGAAVSGIVADQLGHAVHAARHAGRVAVFEAHPPQQLVADESHEDGGRCPACAAIDQHVYPDLAAALVDYGSGGYRACAGGQRCRGTLRPAW